MDPNQISINTFNDLADLYQEKYFHLQEYNATYTLFCEQVLKPGAKVLELGCGPGNITRYLLSQRPDFQILATDAAPNMTELAKKNNPAAEVRVMDARDLSVITQTFDALVLGFCLPYLNKEDVTRLFENAYRVLEEGGTMYLSTIEGEYKNSSLLSSASTGRSVYTYYYNEELLKQLYGANRFELLHSSRIQLNHPNTPDNADLILILRKK
ncbi:MAG: class I SAM-dependent methyltransferase [Bacteroidia bacterium]|nr:class I SAM-dependent methyltransferase [Bacteroidia bacterium]